MVVSEENIQGICAYLMALYSYMFSNAVIIIIIILVLVVVVVVVVWTG
jgi:hypothetical protein